MNKNIMNIVNIGDRICATLECNGRRLASISGTHFASLLCRHCRVDRAQLHPGLARRDRSGHNAPSCCVDPARSGSRSPHG